MNAYRLCVATVLAVWMAMTAAQDPQPTGERGSIPPGTSRDESRSGEGAITGGSVAAPKPGEPSTVESNRELRREISRCKELKGVLREQCLRDVDNAAAGATRPPPGKEPPAPRTD